MKVFISHSSKDIEFVRRLVSDLRNYGIDPWYSENEILVADSIIARMNDGLRNSKFVIAVLSEDSMNSPWVTAEINLAIYEEIANCKTFLIPIILRSCDIPPLLRAKKFVSFITDYDYAFKELIDFLGTKEIKKLENDNYIGKAVTSVEEVNSIFSINDKRGNRNQQQLNDLILECQCLRRGKFQLTSGSNSNYYIMPRKIFENKRAKTFFANHLVRKIQKEGEKYDAILFPALTDGGILGNILAEELDTLIRIPIHIAHNKRDINLENIDVTSLTNLNCLFADDVITSGKSIQLAVNTLLQHGINLKCVAALFCRNINTFNLLTDEFNKKNVRLISSFFAEIPPFVNTEAQETKVEKIN